MNEQNAIERVSPRDVDTSTMPALDVRTHPGKEQIRGALRYDAKTLLVEEPLALPLAHDSRIVVYADDEGRAAQVAARLRHEGYTKASILDGGFEAYKKAGLPTEEITQQQPIPGSEAGIPRI
jgi:rhodanese-related sulfurtransferase